MRPMLTIAVLVLALVIAIALTAIAAFNLTAAFFIGLLGLLTAAIYGHRRDPPQFRWVATVALGGVLTGILLFKLYDYSPFVVRIHNSSNRTLALALRVGHRTLPEFRLGPGQTTWRHGGLTEGIFALDCDDGSGSRMVDIEGYVTNGMSVSAEVDIPTCATAKVTSKMDLL